MDLKKWIADHFEQQHIDVSQAMLRQLTADMTLAGFATIESAQATLARKTLDKLANKPTAKNVQASAVRTAAVVGADDNCPRCGAPMRDVKVGASPARYCTNPKCRVTCHIEVD